MSLARTALRLALIEALGANPVVAGLCGDRIYDSRIAEFASDEPVPVIVVLTEDDAGEAFSRNNGGPPFDQKVSLVVEIAARQFAVDGDEVVILTPVTDRQLDAQIDLLEEAVTGALTVDATPQSLLVRELVTRRVTAKASIRFASDKAEDKSAVRVVTYTVFLKNDEQDASDPPTGDYAVLPEPLRSVCEATTEGSSARATCDLLKSAFPVTSEELFTGADAVYGAQDLSSEEPAKPAGEVETFGQEIDIP